VVAQIRAEMRHHRFARLQQQARQVTVGKGIGRGARHLFNILNDSARPPMRVYAGLGPGFEWCI